jgi:hypothetical protein
VIQFAPLFVADADWVCFYRRRWIPLGGAGDACVYQKKRAENCKLCVILLLFVFWNEVIL